MGQAEKYTPPHLDHHRHDNDYDDQEQYDDDDDDQHRHDDDDDKNHRDYERMLKR